jgi:hypothetical protein
MSGWASHESTRPSLSARIDTSSTEALGCSTYRMSASWATTLRGMLAYAPETAASRTAGSGQASLPVGPTLGGPVLRRSPSYG